ncbi:MAG: monovalent cation/H(+) antiporter subunit G [Pseudomonadota bacterium]|nr:monovalent cation/H(+) antiporter subunit G [Pseudomonadota bacterium]
MIEWLADGLMLAGALFCLLGSIGMHRFPDFYSRLHAAGITDTLGTMLLLIGLAMQADAGDGLKLLLVFSFLFFTSPVAAHSLANAAFKSGDKPRLGASNDD